MTVSHGVDRTAVACGSGGSSTALLQDGSVAFTANWDAGSFEIRAATFESDVVTGTAPFTIASTTVVTNLNAHLLDGHHASEIVPVTDHGALDGLADDDHPQYILVSGARSFTGDVTIDKTEPKLKLIRTANTAEDSEVRFCESDGDKRFSINHVGPLLRIDGHTSGGAFSVSYATFDGTTGYSSLGGGAHVVIGGGSAVSELRLMEAGSAGSNYTVLKAPDSIASSYSLTLPAALGSTNHVLQNSSGVLSFAAESTGFTSVSSSMTGAAYVDFTGIPTGVLELCLMLYGAKTGHASDYFYACIGDSGGVETADYTSRFKSIYGATPTRDANEGATSSWTLSQNTMGDDSDYIDGCARITLVRSSTNTWICSGVFGSSSVPGICSVSGSKALSAALDRVRVGETSNSNPAAGTATLLYK